MARISELHYSNAYARTSGVDEFLEVALGSGDNAADYIVSFYQADGSVGIEIPLTHPDVQMSIDTDNGEVIHVISAGQFPILLTDPDGGSSDNYEAYALTNTDLSQVIDFYDIGGGTQNIVAFDGAAVGAVSENLPVLVGPNSTTTTLQFNQPDPDSLSHETESTGDTGVACFVAGTRILTPAGQRQIESLHEGDIVWTRDNGPLPLRWIGRRTVVGRGGFAPVQIMRGTYGAKRAHYVSQNHRILVAGWRAELLFGQTEILVPAKALVDDIEVRIREMSEVTYFHLLFDSHQIVCGDGVQSESYFPGARVFDGTDAEAQAELVALFPELTDGVRVYGDTARFVCPVQLAALLH